MVNEAAGGFIVGVIVTWWLHAGGGYPKGFWQEPLWSTRARRANFPVGATLATVAAGVSWLVGGPTQEIGAAGLGMGLAAIGGWVVDPLPPVPKPWRNGLVMISGIECVPMPSSGKYVTLHLLSVDPMILLPHLTVPERQDLHRWSIGPGRPYGVAIPVTDEQLQDWML